MIKRVVALLILSCNSVSAAESPALSPFNEFFDQIKNSEYQKSDLSEKAFTEFKDFLLKIYSDQNVPKSLFRNGQVLDCLPTNQQPALRFMPGMQDYELATQTPPDDLLKTPKIEKQAETKTSPEVLVSQTTNKEKCPEGHSPIVRHTLENMSKYTSLKDYLAGGRVFATEGSTNTHKYAHATQTMNNYGGSSSMNVWNPDPDPGVFSLSQHWYSGGNGSDPDNPHQTLEGGWVVHDDDHQPKLFAAYTADNYKHFCSNTACFIVYDSPPIVPGEYLPDDWISVSGGTSKGYTQTWFFNDNRWWLSINNRWIGYFPASYYGTGQLSRYATKVDYGGEVSPHHDSSATGQMGSGQFASAGLEQAAYQSYIYYTDTNNRNYWATLSPYQNTPECYTIDLQNYSSTSNPTYFYFGGPGCD